MGTIKQGTVNSVYRHIGEIASDIDLAALNTDSVINDIQRLENYLDDVKEDVPALKEFASLKQEELKAVKGDVRSALLSLQSVLDFLGSMEEEQND